MIAGAIQTERAKALTVRQEIALLETAVRAKADARPLRLKLAQLLLVEDRFDAVLGMLPDDVAQDSYREAMLRFQAHISRETDDDDRCAAEAAERAVALAEDDGTKAAALADLGKAQRRLGRMAEAEANWRRALELAPAQANATKRIAALLLETGRAGELLALTDRLVSRGAAHARLFAARALAQCALDDPAGARATAGIDALRFEAQLPTPDGWTSIDAFNADLVREVTAHPGLRFDRYGTASSQTWRVDDPLTGSPPAVAALQSALAAMCDGFIASLDGCGHPWFLSRPATCRLHSWCVITDGAGFEHWHVHQQGWMSGVYYAAVPGHVRSGNRDGGCLAWGIDDALVGAARAQAFGTCWLRPQPGLVTAFPSHLYHRTYPHEASEQRVAFAFDIRAG